MITQQILKENLLYDEYTGIFTRLKSSKRWKNTIAGSMKKHGGIIIAIDNKEYQAHRLAWLYVYGVLPSKHLDHINGDRSDNRICNLRECDDFENQQNRSTSKRNKLGLAGVSYSQVAKKYRAEISAYGKKYFLGYFDDPKDAHKTYLDAKSKYHKFSPILR